GRLRSQDRLGLSAVPGDILLCTGDEQVVLVLEVKVERADGDAGVAGDLLHRGLLDPVIAEALAGCLKNALSLVVHRRPPQDRFRTMRLTAPWGRSTKVVSSPTSWPSAG